MLDAQTSLHRAIACPGCHGSLGRDAAGWRCSGCGRTYATQDGVHRLVLEPPDTAHHRFYSTPDAERFGRDADGMPSSFAALVHDFVAGLQRDALVVEIGAGRSAFRDAHPGHVPTDYSFFALRDSSAREAVQADAQRLPFRDASLDAVFSIATLEHVPQPGRALGEIDRCLRPGGQALIYPAWYVRPWAAKALAVRAFAELPLADRLRKLSIPLRDSKPFQFAKVLPGRIATERRIRAGDPVGLRYRRLEPNLVEYLTSDSDAFTSLDPQGVSAFFVSRGYADRRRSTARSRLLYAYEPVWVIKPER